MVDAITPPVLSTAEVPAELMVELVIDGRPVSVPAGTTVWDAARTLGVEIPVLCHDPRYRPVGVCRMCVVDVGGRVLAAACVRPCEANMKVTTQSPAIEGHRAMLTALLLADQPADAAAGAADGKPLHALAGRYGLEIHGRPTVVRTWTAGAAARRGAPGR